MERQITVEKAIEMILSESEDEDDDEIYFDGSDEDFGFWI